MDRNEFRPFPLKYRKKLIIEKHSVKIRRQIKGKMRADMGGVQSVNVFSASDTFCSLAYFVAKTSQEQQRYCRAKPASLNSSRNLLRPQVLLSSDKVCIWIVFWKTINPIQKTVKWWLPRYLLVPDLEVLKQSCQTLLCHFPRKFLQQFFERCLQQLKECHLIDGGHLDRLKGLQFIVCWLS